MLRKLFTGGWYILVTIVVLLAIVISIVRAYPSIYQNYLPVIQEILNESNSRLLPPDDVEAWADALGSLLSDPGQRDWLAAHAREDASQYGWVTRAERVLDGLTSAAQSDV